MARVLKIDQTMQRRIRDGLDLLDIEVVVFGHALQLSGGLRLDELRSGNMHQHALFARLGAAFEKSSVDGFRQL